MLPTLAVPLDRLAAYQIILIEVLEEYTDISDRISPVIRATPEVILFIVSLLYSNQVTMSVFEIIHLNLSEHLYTFSLLSFL